MATKPSKSAFEKIRESAKERMGKRAAKTYEEGTKAKFGTDEWRGSRETRASYVASKRRKVGGGWLLNQARKNPVRMGLGVANLALMFGPGLVKGLRDSLNIGGYMDEQTDRLIGAQAELNSYARMQRRREEELNRLMQVNTAMLAQRSPELYNQIMAGRRLPQQATVIGGQPREDLLREVARGMSEGRYGTPEEMMGG